MKPAGMSDNGGRWRTRLRRILWDQRTRAQFMRFLFTGVINTLFSYLVFSALIWVGLQDISALAIATIAGILFNFQTIGRVVFREMQARLFFRFLLVYALVFVVNACALRYLHTHGFGSRASQAMLLPLIVLLSFSLNKLLVFGRSR
ncbi:MAG TPA: GtrA family protein [Dongiaceae bacterium]|jgi:putative flippase GtrA|nr:GtrA family protein [Dongiaceae bacterium]